MRVQLQTSSRAFSNIAIDSGYSSDSGIAQIVDINNAAGVEGMVAAQAEYVPIGSDSPVGQITLKNVPPSVLESTAMAQEVSRFLKPGVRFLAGGANNSRVVAAVQRLASNLGFEPPPPPSPDDAVYYVEFEG